MADLLKEAPRRVNNLIDRQCYLGAVNHLNTAIANMFDEDLCNIGALSPSREELMDQKGRILEFIVEELKEALLG